MLLLLLTAGGWPAVRRCCLSDKAASIEQHLDRFPGCAAHRCMSPPLLPLPAASSSHELSLALLLCKGGAGALST